MKDWGYKLIIVVGVCMCIAPGVIGIIGHGIKYGWFDVLKILWTVSPFVGGMILVIFGFYLKRKRGLKKLIELKKSIESIDKIES